MKPWSHAQKYWLGHSEVGKASYYHQKFEGRRTSSGEIFNQNKLTCAHRKYLFNTMLRVTNLQNDRSVIVRVNDRGPYKYAGRIIDLSKAAANKIGMVKNGVVSVKVEVIGVGGIIEDKYSPSVVKGAFDKGKYYSFRGQLRSPKGYGIQLAAFEELQNAQYYAQIVFKEGFRPVLVYSDSSHQHAQASFYKVIVGEFTDKSSAMKYLPELKSRDFYGFVVEYKD